MVWPKSSFKFFKFSEIEKTKEYLFERRDNEDDVRRQNIDKRSNISVEISDSKLIQKISTLIRLETGPKKLHKIKI